MDRGILGATGLKVSPLALGTMTFGNPVNANTSFDLLDLAVEQGINFLDTANTYNAGLSEEIIGQWLKARGHREQLVIASKVRNPVGDDPDSVGLSPRVILQQLENSLKRLNTDYLDIYFLHQPDDDTPIETTWRCLDAIVASGRVRCLGLSNFAAWQCAQTVQLANHRGWAPPTVTQALYNVISRAVETELLPMVNAYGLGTCMYNPLAGGLLTGKHDVGEEANPRTRLAYNTTYRARYWNDRQRTAAHQICEIAREAGRSPVELALRFMLDHPTVDVTLIGATSIAQLQDNLAAAQAAPLSNDEQQACQSAWEALQGPVPRYNRGSGGGRT